MILRPGDRAPDFSIPDQHGAIIHLAEVAERSAVVLVFVPFAFSPVCGDEISALNGWQDRLRSQRRGVEIIAVSADSKYTLAAWAAERGVDVRLGSDFWPHGRIARSYGVFDSEHGVAERGVFAISTGGTIVSGRQVARTQTRDFTEDIDAALSSL